MFSLKAIRTASPVFRNTSAWASPAKMSWGKPLRLYSTAHSGTVKELTELPGFFDFIKNENVSVVDFYATWCGPCKALEPIYNMFAERIPEVQFGRVDVDEAQDIATEYAISAMPTCLIFKDGENVGKIVGADPHKLLEMIQEHANVDLKSIR